MTVWLVLMAAAPAKSKAATDSGWTAADWAAVLSAAFAAVAALASLVAVLQNKRVMSTTLRPLLTGVVLPSGYKDPVLQFHNAGGAVAIAVRALWAYDGRRAAGDVVPGISTGGTATTVAALPKDGLAASGGNGVVVYRDARQSVYANSLDGHEKVWRNRWWAQKLDVPDLDEVFERFYGYSVRDWEAVELRYAHRESDRLVLLAPPDESPEPESPTAEPG